MKQARGWIDGEVGVTSLSAEQGRGPVRQDCSWVVRLMKGVSVGMCHRRGSQGRGGLCVAGRVYILVWLTQRNKPHI